MKAGIHPEMHKTKVVCSCGATYEIQGTLKELHTEICMSCHPHYTGKKKLVDTEGRVEKFMSKFKQSSGTSSGGQQSAKKDEGKKKEEKKEEVEKEEK